MESTTSTSAPSPARSKESSKRQTEPLSARVPALDWMRGVVMLLMTTDHASGAFNAGRLMTDGTWMYTPGAPLPAAQFVTRWISHLCAPTFVFLAGAALALSTEKRLRQGESSKSVDRHLLIRGLFIASLDPFWMTWAFVPGSLLLQVMYAIGMSLVCMVVLRRLKTTWLLVSSLGIMLFDEAVIRMLTAGWQGTSSFWIALLLTGGRFSVSWQGRHFDVIVAYPLLPWLSIMILGWTFGRYLLRMRQSDRLRKARHLLGLAGLGGLLLFVVLRSVNGYGNMGLLRASYSPVQWLHVSKYPPSLAFSSLELGLMAVCLYGFFRLQEQSRWVLASWNPLQVFGQTALFYYLLHAHLLELGAYVFGLSHKLGLGATFGSSAIAAIGLYPACRWYRSYRAAHREGWTQYV